MNKLNILLDHPPTRCEICHKQDLFDSTSGFCSRCSIFINSISSTAIRKNRNISDNSITIKNHGARLEIIIPYFSYEDAIGAIAYLLVSLIAIYYGYYFAIIITLLFLYMTALYLFNKRYVVVNNKELRIFYKPIKSGTEVLIKSDDIAQIYCKKHMLMDMYKVKVLLKSGKEIDLIDDLYRSTQALYIESQLEDHLGIDNKPVNGELRIE